MRIGLHLPQFRVPVDGAGLAGFAQAAEAAGVDDLWVSDHVILPAGSTTPPASFQDPLSVLAWAGAATSRAGLGTSVLVAPYRHPVLLARSLAAVDALSGGRVIAGVGSGWLEAEFAALDVPFRERGRRTDAAIAACRALWRSDDRAEWPGGNTRDMVLAPGPARAGGPPIWVGGDSDAGIARAVRLGDGWHTTISDAERLPGRIAALERALADAGRTRTGFVLSVRVRADAGRQRRVIPRLRDLGVDHVLVDDPDERIETLTARVGALRALAGDGGS